MNDDKIRISPDALIAMIVTEAQDRELARMPSLEEMNEDFQPSEKFQRKMEALVRDTKRKAEREKRLLNVKRFFITLTAAISIFSCTMLPVKAVREAVITTLIEWHDKFVSIIYVNEESPVSTFHITPSSTPSSTLPIEGLEPIRSQALYSPVAVTYSLFFPGTQHPFNPRRSVGSSTIMRLLILTKSSKIEW